MISKSLSRKTPSFGQLAGYMSESGYLNSQKSDARFQIFQHCFSRDAGDIAAEFHQNSKLLAKRKNGNYLYHEILSITIEKGVDREFAKDALRDLALGYVAKRCPSNMVYGCLHDDHSDHIHYHLMISANEKGSSKRYWITKKSLDEIKRQTELRCLKEFPELMQRPVMTASAQEKKQSRKAAEEKRRKGRLERYERVRKFVFEAMIHTSDLRAFEEKLGSFGCELYQRGKAYGVKVLHPDGKVEKFRFKTLGVQEEFTAYLANIASLEAAQNVKADEELMSVAQPEANANAAVGQHENSETEKLDEEMNMKDVAGIAETYSEKVKQASEPTKNDIHHEAQTAKEEAIESLRKEFEKTSKQQSQNQSQGQKK